MQEFLSENEVIEPLILVLKQCLKTSNQNDPYFGGLSSYALFLMLVSYLQACNVPKTIASGVNFGKLLLDFLSFYGHFDAEATGIYTFLPNKKPDRHNHYSLLQNFIFQNNSVQIDDPLNYNNNVGKSSFNFY